MKSVMGVGCWCCVLILASQAEADNLTIIPNVSAGFTQAEQDVIDASISMWESLLSVPEPRTVTLNFDKGVLTDALGVTSNVTTDVLGNPIGADITVDSGTAFFVDTTPFDNSEYTLSGLDDPFHFVANAAGPADGKEDLLSLVSHEIGHALGWGGFDRFDSRLFDPGNGTVAYAGETLLFDIADDTFHPIHDFDLMGDVGFQNSERALISSFDIEVLDDAFDYNNKKILHYNGGTVSLADAVANNVPVKTQITLDVTEHATIQDLDIALFIEHTFDQDLDIELVSPSGTRIVLASAVGADTDDFGTTELWTRFDDESIAFDILNANETGPFPGTFLPAEFLETFDGEDIFGTWTLEISDFFPGDTGTLNDFALIVKVPEPGTLRLLAIAGGFILRRPKRVAA